MEHHAEPWYADPHVAVAAAFVLFLGVYLKWVHPAIVRGLDNRSAKIRDQLDQANSLRAEAETLLAQYKAQQQAALKEAEAIVEGARAEAAALRAKGADELRQALARRTAQAEEKIARMQSDAVRDLKTQMVEIATEAARQVIGQQLAQQKDDPAITRALSAIEQQIH